MSFEYVTKIANQSEITLIANRITNAIVVTNCTTELLLARSNRQIEFELDIGKKIDLTRLNLLHCFKKIRTVADFLPAIHSIVNWPESDFTMMATVYNQLEIDRLQNRVTCEPTLPVTVNSSSLSL